MKWYNAVKNINGETGLQSSCIINDHIRHTHTLIRTMSQRGSRSIKILFVHIIRSLASNHDRHSKYYKPSIKSRVTYICETIQFRRFTCHHEQLEEIVHLRQHGGRQIPLFVE
jgi:hypothetical protein